MKKLIEKVKALSFNSKVTIYALSYITVCDIFYVILCFVTNMQPSDAWYLGHVTLWGVELALNFGIYKDKAKRVHMSADGSIVSEKDCDEV